MWKYVFLAGSLIGALCGIANRDALSAAVMGGAIGFQLALWLTDREQTKRPRDAKRQVIR